MRLTRGLVLLLCASPAFGQQGAPNPGVDREAMWFAPTAEDWAKACLIPWQRSWEDALAVARETGKPILICVNMDGEIASEHYAGVRYRQPDIAALYEPYVCVIASVYRHTERDYDEAGRRVVCPRFGTVTCSEHVWIEPFLFERYFEGVRVAPRHIMVELEGGEQYDVYYAWDTDSVFGSIREGIAQRPPPPPRPERGDRSLAERVASRDARDREAVETAFAAGDPALRRALLDAAAALGGAAPIELLRQAIFGLDLEQSRAALAALAQAEAGGAVDLIADALRGDLAPDARDALVSALERHGAEHPRARTLAAVHRGLTARATDVDVGRWRGALAGTQATAMGDYSAAAAALDGREATRAARPEDPGAALDFAEALLAHALEPRAESSSPAARRVAARLERLRFEDALTAADSARALGASGWRLEAVTALTNAFLGNADAAHAAAERAMPLIPPGESSWNAMATIALFAQARREAIDAAVREKREWPPRWMAEVHAAYSILAQHPRGEPKQAVAHYDFLVNLNAHGPASEALSAALQRFPADWDLHDRWRNRLLADRGVAALEPAYAAWAAEQQEDPARRWYAGVASFVAAEVHRRGRAPAQADAGYARAQEAFERATAGDETLRDSADHYVALALAGRARLALERTDLEAATTLLTASFTRRPASAATLDGLNLSPSDTSRALRARLERADRRDLLAQLDAALAQVDPALLGLPAFESSVAPGR